MKKISIMGIINLTNDSFSNDGILRLPVDQQVQQLKSALSAGADIIDIGGQSTRPTSTIIKAEEEWRRIEPLLQAISKDDTIDIQQISLDTFLPEVAEKALKIGVGIINDVSSLSSPALAKITADYKAKMIIMHRRDFGLDLKDSNAPSYKGDEAEKNFLETFIKESQELIAKALKLGMKAENLIFDPGIGFGKTPLQNIEIIKNCKTIKDKLQLPILIGTSRKSFIAKLCKPNKPNESNELNELNELNDPTERLGGSLATIALAGKYIDMVRVHDISATAQFLAILHGNHDL